MKAHLQQCSSCERMGGQQRAEARRRGVRGSESLRFFFFSSSPSLLGANPRRRQVDPQTSSYDPSPLIPYIEGLGVTYHYLSHPIVEQAAKNMKVSQPPSDLAHGQRNTRSPPLPLLVPPAGRLALRFLLPGEAWIVIWMLPFQRIQQAGARPAPGRPGRVLHHVHAAQRAELSNTPVHRCVCHCAEAWHPAVIILTILHCSSSAPLSPSPHCC